jgi:hypothetical protein
LHALACCFRTFESLLIELFLWLIEGKLREWYFLFAMLLTERSASGNAEISVSTIPTTDDTFSYPVVPSLYKVRGIMLSYLSLDVMKDYVPMNMYHQQQLLKS